MPDIPPADSTSVTPPANVPPSASLNASPPPQQETVPLIFENLSTFPASALKLTDGAGCPPPFSSASPAPARKMLDFALNVIVEKMRLSRVILVAPQLHTSENRIKDTESQTSGRVFMIFPVLRQ